MRLEANWRVQPSVLKGFSRSRLRRGYAVTTILERSFAVIAPSTAILLSTALAGKAR